MGLADMALMLQAERDRERREADRQTRLAQERLKRVYELEETLRWIRDQDPVENALDPQWAARMASGVLPDERNADG